MTQAVRAGHATNEDGHSKPHPSQDSPSGCACHRGESYWRILVVPQRAQLTGRPRSTAAARTRGALRLQCPDLCWTQRITSKECSVRPSQRTLQCCVALPVTAVVIPCHFAHLSRSACLCRDKVEPHFRACGCQKLCTPHATC